MRGSDLQKKHLHSDEENGYNKKDNTANRDLFTDRENALLVNVSNAYDLADVILKLRDEKMLKEKISDGMKNEEVNTFDH